MVVAKGFDIVAGRSKAAAWGTAVDVDSADNLLPLISESLMVDQMQIDDNSLVGSSFRRNPDKGAVGISGAVETYLKYDGLELDIAMVMGRSGTPTKRGSVPPAYYNDYSIKDDLETYFTTLVIDKQVAIDEFDSVKYGGMTISGDAGDRLKISFDLIARKFNNASVINTGVSAITEPLPRKYVLFEDCRFLMNANASAALASGVDDVYPSAFSITINNNMSGDLTAENDPYVDEPLRSGFGDISGTITIPKYKDTVSVDAMIAGTTMKMAIRCISSTQICTPGNGAYYYEFSMLLPSIKITEAPREVGGEGNIPGTFSFTAHTPDSAPDGMDGAGSALTADDEARTSVNKAFAIETTSVVKANPLS